jgi:putative oxidoreductase
MKNNSTLERKSIFMLNAKLSVEDRGITILRFVVAILLGIHGIYRGWTGGAKFFGDYLTEAGLPLGIVIAWSITIFEIFGMALLLLRHWVIPVALVFIFILSAGIVMVHAREGWFVVGGGRNGVEYSILLIASLTALSVSTRDAARKLKQTGDE